MQLIQAKNKIASLESQQRSLEGANRELENDLNKLREINFDLETNRQTVDMMRK